jgi:hypothetical protein
MQGDGFFCNTQTQAVARDILGIASSEKGLEKMFLII